MAMDDDQERYDLEPQWGDAGEPAEGSPRGVGTAAVVERSQVDALQVMVLRDSAAVAQQAARMAVIALTAGVQSMGQGSAILATGQTQLLFLGALAADSAVPWSAITLFHLDEYWGLGADHPAGFQRYLRDRIGHLIHPRAFHYLQGDTPEPIAECDRYGALLPEFVDLCCLGIGNNGHLAFNEPGLASLEDLRRVKLVRLAESTRQQQVQRGAFSELAAVPQYALTLTLSAIAASRRILCLAIGPGKAEVVRQALTGPISAQCPASLLRTQSQGVLLLDLEAARLL